jgi:hypothetical protein
VYIHVTETSRVGMATKDNEQHILFFLQPVCITVSLSVEAKDSVLLQSVWLTQSPISSVKGALSLVVSTQGMELITSPPSIDINNVWRYIFTSSYTFMERDIFPISHLPVLLLGYHEKFL